jgi:hypothetical protein
MDTEGGGIGVGVVESEEAELVEGAEKAGSESVSEVKAKGLRGPVAGEGDVMGGAKALAREVGAPGSIGGREEALNRRHSELLMVQVMPRAPKSEIHQHDCRM